jgi:hypothetical protein
MFIFLFLEVKKSMPSILRKLLKDTQAKLLRDNQANFMMAIVTLLGVMFATIIGAVVFFAFADNIVGTSPESKNTTDQVKIYAVIVFTMLAIVPLIIVGGLMLRSLGFFGGGGVP